MKVAPVIDRNRCEGKADCVRVCLFEVFQLHVLGKEQRRALTLRGRLKAWAHGGRQALVANPQACHACRLCVAASSSTTRGRRNASTARPMTSR